MEVPARVAIQNFHHPTNQPINQHTGTNKQIEITKLDTIFWFSPPRQSTKRIQSPTSKLDPTSLLFTNQPNDGEYEIPSLRDKVHPGILDLPGQKAV